MGKYGSTVNTIAILYLVVVFVFSFFPLATPVVGSTMNWNILIYGFVISFAMGYFFVKGRHVYLGPVVHVKVQ